MADFSGYPICKTGDVLIILSASIQFQLHAEILRRHCRFFAKNLVEQTAFAVKEKGKKAVPKVRWQFNLQTNRFGDSYIEMITNAGKSTTSTNNFPTGFFGAGQTLNGVVEQYVWVLDAVYNRPLSLNSPNMGHLLAESHGILNIAEELGCIHTVNRTLDSLLVEYGQVLWQAIAKNPLGWVDVAIRINSFNILKEVAIHLVGKWAMLTSGERNDLPEKLRLLCEKKNLELEQKKEDIEMKLNAYYPNSMKRDNSMAPDQQTRSSYSNDIINWMCASAFRQWLCKQIIRKNARFAADGGFGFYNSIHRGRDAFLSEKGMTWFYKQFSMSTRGQHNLQGQLNDFKTGLKPIVACLVENKCNLDLSRHPVTYLTCANFSRNEILDLWQAAETLDWANDGKQQPRGKRNRSEELFHVDDEHKSDDSLPDGSSQAEKRARFGASSSMSPATADEYAVVH